MGTFYNLGTGRARAFFIRSHVNLCKAEIGQMTGSKIKSKSGALGIGKGGWTARGTRRRVGRRSRRSQTVKVEVKTERERSQGT